MPARPERCLWNLAGGRSAGSGLGCITSAHRVSFSQVELGLAIRTLLEGGYRSTLGYAAFMQCDVAAVTTGSEAILCG